ncbi:MAG TPA: hypothetical protein VGO00_17445 [Kofleriaceae bacterium]|nr:hypothetical protein [Kofleriaceae bacterium]
MVESEITIGLLREIRDEIKANGVELKSEIGGLRSEVKSEIGGLRTEVGELRSTLEVTNERLAVVERTVNDAATQILFLGRYVKNRTDVDIDELELRVSKLEDKLPD